MTITSERLEAINRTRKFLLSLLVPSETPRVPKEIRDRARWCLRHYPWACHVSIVMPDGEIVPDTGRPIIDGDVILR